MYTNILTLSWLCCYIELLKSLGFTSHLKVFLHPKGTEHYKLQACLYATMYEGNWVNSLYLWSHMWPHPTSNP